MMKNEKGSTLVFSLIVTMVLTILIVASLVIAGHYHLLSLRAHQRHQIDLTIQALAETIALEIQSGNSDFIPNNESTPISYTNIQMAEDPLDHRQATINVIEKNTYSIVVEGSLKKENRSVQLTLTKADGKWQKVYSSKGEIMYEKQQ